MILGMYTQTDIIHTQNAPGKVTSTNISDEVFRQKATKQIHIHNVYLEKSSLRKTFPPFCSADSATILAS